MKYILPFVVLTLVSVGADAASHGRPAMSNKVMSAPRYTVSANQLTAAASANKTEKVVVTEEKKAEVDMREAERNACINNNIGIGNTFVWASRYSDTSNYANMVEDVANPQNNVCFARVELKSDDESRVSVSDVAPKYFMWGESIECGSWADQKAIEKRILDARKGARIGGIVASTVGGAGLGVGAMELFGNKLIGGRVEGQKNAKMSDEDKIKFYRSMYKEDANGESIKSSVEIMAQYREDNKNWTDYTVEQKFLMDHKKEIFQ